MIYLLKAILMYKNEEEYYQFINNYLIDNRINEVFYEELSCFDDEEYWNLSDDIHSVDMNIILVLENGKILQIKWGHTFYSYGVEIEELMKINIREGIRTINMTYNHKWQNYLGKKIIDITVLWDASNSIKLPQTWQIQFENNEYVWISTFEITKGQTNYYWADHLTVFFKEENVKQYGLDKFQMMKRLG
jgi:hypothetical protein